MNVEIATRLMNYRKKAGLSQEELADKLGVSRQAVSKWECSESSPDTDNLIALAKIYGVSLDELINGDAPANNKEKKNDEGLVLKDDEGNEVHFKKGGVELVDEKGEKKDIYYRKRGKHKLRAAEDIISSITVLLVVAAYLLLGFLTKDGWSHYWVLFFLITITPSILPAIYYRKFTLFAYPMVVVMLYLTLGMFADWWHPGWVLFITIPIYYMVFGPIDRLISRKVKVNDQVIDAKEYDDGDIK